LQPLEQHLPLAAKRIGPHFKLAKIQHQRYLIFIRSLKAMDDFRRELEVGGALARQAGETALRYFRKGIAFERKPDDSPVTAADRACEDVIARALDEAFPDDGMLGEEGASHPATAAAGLSTRSTARAISCAAAFRGPSCWRSKPMAKLPRDSHACPRWANCTRLRAAAARL
jgi:3'-phosphoadenosine 5'-phosphosulfate (PAPS) 3'-phosphatase